MNGHYETIDNCIYEIFDQKIGKSKNFETMARCVKSTVREGEFEAFKLLPGQLERNIKSGAWTKIEQ